MCVATSDKTDIVLGNEDMVGIGSPVAEDTVLDE